MASVSVVERGPHGLDSEPQILLLKLHSSKKRVPPCWETGMLARSDPRAAGAETPPGPRGPGPAGWGPGPAGRAPGPGEGCRADPPRSPEEGGRGVTGGTPGAQTGRTPGSFQRTAHRHRDGRRSCCRSGDAGHTGVLLERLTQGRTGVVRLARSEPPRREAWAIFSPEMDPRVRAESGEGHRFQDKPVKQDWCDACSRLITAQALKCQNCSYTCHLACESRVQLDCNQRDKEPEETPSPRSVSSPAAPLHKVRLQPSLDATAEEQRLLLDEQRTVRCERALTAAECHSSRAAFRQSHPLSSAQRGAPESDAGPPPADLSMTVNTVLTPSMTSSNSMSSGYCSLDDESEDFTFFTAKTSFFRQPKPKQAAKQSETKQEEEGGTKELSEEEVRTRIEEYNAQVSKNGMKLATDGSYTGFIKVHLRLNRPVTVPALETAGSEGASSKLASSHSRTLSEKQDQPDCGHVDKRTSFYLPCDCVKRIHIGSMTTTKEVIQGLLKKFMVLDNPRKFALYKQTHRDGQDLFQKLPLPERPLVLRLVAGPDTEQLTFVLKENETEEVEWHAFSLPELQNFLVILQKEEAERIRAVEQKYTIYRQKLQHALQQHDSEP